MDEHENHDTVSAAAQKTEKQKQLKETQKTLQQRIQQREKDVQQLREAVESHKRSAQTAVEDSERIFTELIRSTERSRSELIRLIRDQEKAAVSRAEGRLERLEQEINDLRRRDAELEQLSHTQDHIQFLQSSQSLSAPPESTDVNDDLFSSLFSSDGLRESVHQLRNKLEGFCKEQLKKISDRATFTNIVFWTKKDFLQYSHQLTLDLNTAHKHLHLSENNRNQLKETQKRFQQRIQQREKDLQQLREAVESHKRSAQTAVEDSERIFTELIRSIERSRSELIRLIRDQEKAAVSRAEGRLERLEQEINDLRRRDAELEQLSHTQDHIQFLQTFQFLSAPPESTDVNEDPFSSLISSDGLRECVHQLRDKLEDFCKEELKKISDRVTSTNIVLWTRKDFLQSAEQRTEKQKQLKETQKTFQQRIQQREKDVQQLREAVESHKRSAQTAVEDSERIFTELIRSIERSRSELIRLIRDQEKAAVSRAEGRLERLEQEINDLRRRDAELEQLSHTQDHIQFLQSFQSLSVPPESTDANDNHLISLISFDGLRESVHQLKDKLEDFCKEELKKISDRATFTKIVPRKDLLQYSHQLTLDLNTKQLREVHKVFQQRIQQREKDVQQLREAVESHKRSAQTAVEDSERIFTELIRSIERSRSELIRLIRDQEKAAVSRAEGRLERLEQEINDLRRDAELEQLSHTQDHIQFLQLRDKLEDFCKEELKKISDRVTFPNIVPRTKKDFLQYSHQLTLDLNTVNKRLHLSEGNRVITYTDTDQLNNMLAEVVEKLKKTKLPADCYAGAEKQLKETQKTLQQRIQQREKDVHQLREAVESHKAAVKDSERISELIRLIRDQEKAAVSRAEGRLVRLEQEINDLRRRDAELDQLSHTQDHIQFLQSFQSLSVPPESTDENYNSFHSLFSFDGLRESVHQLRDKLEDLCKEELKKISDRATFTKIVPRTRKDFLQYSHQLTLDLNTEVCNYSSLALGKH
ncbi:hypothetical protein Q8A67_014032 [Cirrhinus molitorella]|uniref:TRIM8/14/16/25/29/45/65 coiled-coil region domain-containing protein n=1 Tax=Cirrhinus molitorella TaxID=172907 RepID=A0AA88PJE5_9TELE|nr:hypothetical protein Q8A67_014032 [Cirrhinus molitorella]